MAGWFASRSQAARTVRRVNCGSSGMVSLRNSAAHGSARAPADHSLGVPATVGSDNGLQDLKICATPAAPGTKQTMSKPGRSPTSRNRRARPTPTSAGSCRSTCLAPDIVEAILDGRQPKGLRLAEMLGNGPLAWEQQRVKWDFC